ncbi:MAG: hypothetical protein ACRBFS_19930 [Aureispira sp.]
MKTLLKLLLVTSFLLATQQAFAQYSKVSFKTKQPLQLWVDGEAVNDGYAKYFKLRLNQGRSYELKFYVEDGSGIVVSETIMIGAKERKSDYMVKYHKRKQQYRLIVKSAKDKVSVADGLRNMGTMSYSAESTSARADENGVSVEHSKESGAVDGRALGDSVDAVASIFKNDKKKKKQAEDKRTVVVLKVK